MHRVHGQVRAGVAEAPLPALREDLLQSVRAALVARTGHQQGGQSMLPVPGCAAVTIELSEGLRCLFPETVTRVIGVLN